MNDTDALTLRDIEVRIRELQYELEHLHKQKAKLFGEFDIEYTCS